MTHGVGRHPNFQIRQSRALGNSPLKCSDLLVRWHASRIQNHVLHQHHEAGFRVSSVGVITHDKELALETGSSFDDGLVLWVSNNDRSNGHGESTSQLVGTAREENFGWVAGDTFALPRPSSSIVVNGALELGSLVAGAIVHRSVIQDVPVYWVLAIGLNVWCVACSSLGVILLVEPEDVRQLPG